MIDDRFDTLDFWVGRTDTLTRDQLIGTLHRAYARVDRCNLHEISQELREHLVFLLLLQDLGIDLEFQPGKKAIRTGRNLALVHGLKPKAVAA